jgi:L-rhamnose isomerase / sugar isomerase
MDNFRISDAAIAEHNARAAATLKRDYDSLGEVLARRGVHIDSIRDAVARFNVAVPSWGVGTGGTRFARFPGIGEPRNVFEKLEDCDVIHRLGRISRTVSLHFPWDRADDYSRLKAHARDLGLTFDAVNSNTFQDQAGQALSYKYGSLTHQNRETRRQAIEHNLECIEIGRTLGSKAITVWIADGANFPGQQDFTASFERYLESTTEIYRALPSDWLMFLEHKLFEPAFYATVINDWGTSYLAASKLGPQAKCLVDLGHHAPNTNIEMIVARLAWAGKLGGFHFNDSMYGDDDLDSGSIKPFQLFLIFNELVAAERRQGESFKPAYMLDQSHNVTDPIESLLLSGQEVGRAYAKALLIDHAKLRAAQQANDVIEARRAVTSAYQTDVSPILAAARVQQGGACEPIAAYRESGYRERKAKERPQDSSRRSGIV